MATGYSQDKTKQIVHVEKKIASLSHHDLEVVPVTAVTTLLIINIHLG